MTAARSGAGVERRDRHRHEEQPFFIPSDLCRVVGHSSLHVRVRIAADESNDLKRRCGNGVRPTHEVERLLGRGRLLPLERVDDPKRNVDRSPFLAADRAMVPLLLAQGVRDDDTGTSPMQYERTLAGSLAMAAWRGS